MYLIRRETKNYGPFSIREITELLDSGSITRDTEIAPAGTEEWKTIRETGLFGVNTEMRNVR